MPSVPVQPQLGAAAVVVVGGGLAADGIVAAHDKLMQQTLAERRLQAWTLEPSRKQFCVFGTFPGGITQETMTNMLNKSIDVTKHVFDMVHNLTNLNPLVCGLEGMEPRTMSVATLMANLGKLIAMRARMVAKIREDLDLFSTTASQLARLAHQRHAVPPASASLFPPVIPVWTSFQGWVARGGLDNTEAAPSSKANNGVCRFSAANCPYGAECRFSHDEAKGEGSKRKADGAADSGKSKRPPTKRGQRTDGAAGSPAAAPVTPAATPAMNSRAKKKGRAGIQPGAEPAEEDSE
eukprot:g7907.t1